MQKYTGKEYLQIAIASHYGLDKESFEYRIEWVNSCESFLEDIEDEADDYYQYSAAVMAYRKAQKGQPTGYMVSMDACASGIQLLSVLTGCEVGASNSGVTGQTRKDVYATTTEIMNQLLNQDKDYDRAIVKDALMTVMYGSEKQPEIAFGVNTPELEAFYEAAYAVAPGAMNLLPLVQGLWDPEALSYTWDLPDGQVVICKVKDLIETRVHVDTLDHEPTFNYQYTVNTPVENGRFLSANTIHSIDGYIVRELVSRCNHNKGALRTAERLLVGRLKKDIEVPLEAGLYCEKMWHKHKAISIVGVEYITAWSVNQMSKEYCEELLALIRVILKRPSFHVLTIHDCFKCSPNHMDWVRQTYIDLLTEISAGSILNAILSDIANEEVVVNKISTEVASVNPT